MRNFTVIAHIDHGKSTLCDRILELTGDIKKGKHRDLILDSMNLERERGITIKAKAVRVVYGPEVLNIVDTPGHVDFSYEVSRTLAACEGAVLVVDAAQGVEAQTVANMDSAFKNGLTIIPVINKIDLSTARVKSTEEELRMLPGVEGKILKLSAKTGEGVGELLDEIINRIPEPENLTGDRSSGLIFDSLFDPFKGAVAYVRVMGGEFKTGEKIRFLNAGKEYEIKEMGYFGVGKMHAVKKLRAGEIGYVICGIKNLRDIKIGDTITSSSGGVEKALKGFRTPKNFVFAGLYPVENADFGKLKKALDKLSINDTSFSYHGEESPSLGPGFRCGFLGVLHMEIIKGRLEEEYNLELLVTKPQVEYIVDGEKIDNPIDFPLAGYDKIAEPFIEATVITPDDCLGQIFELFESRGGNHVEMKYINPMRVIIKYELPLRELVSGFYSQLKSVSRGYATLDYKHTGHRESKLTKLLILVNGREVDALSFIVPASEAMRTGRSILSQLKEEIPKHQFKIPLQAKAGKNIVARKDIPALKKNVTEGLYGGDVTRKRKQLEKQKKGKKKMKQIGNVSIPPEAFIKVKTYGD